MDLDKHLRLSFVSAYKNSTGHSNTNFYALNIHPYQIITPYPHTQTYLLNISTKPSRTAFINKAIHDHRLTTTPAYTDITHSVSPKLITVANVVTNDKDVRHLGMVMKVLHDDKVVLIPNISATRCSSLPDQRTLRTYTKIAPQYLITIADVMDNRKFICRLGMVVSVSSEEDWVTVYALNPKDPALGSAPCFPTQRLFHQCQTAAEKKRGKEWKKGEFKDGVPLNGTPIQLKFFPTKTETGTEWRIDWIRTDI